MSVNASVQSYVIAPVVPFTTLQTIGLPVTGPAGTVPVSQGIGQSTLFQEVPAAGLDAAIIKAPSALGRNTITPTTDAVDGLKIVGFSSTAQARLLQVIGSGAASSSFAVRPPGSASGISVFISSGNVGDIGCIIQGANAVGAADTLLMIGQDGAGNVLSQRDYQANGSMQIALQSASLPDSVQVTTVEPGFSDSALATYKGFCRFTAGDFNNATRQALIIGANGTAPTIGFLGAAQVVRQTGASAAGIAAILDGNAKAAVSALQTALANLGLITAPA